MFVAPSRAGFPRAVESMWADARTAALREKGFAEHQAMVASFASPGTPYRGLVLFHGLGTGKTSAAAAVIEVWRRHAPARKVCIVTPASIRSEFAAEIQKRTAAGVAQSGSQTPAVDFTFVNSNGLSAKVMRELQTPNGNALHDTLIIVDEAHSISRSLASSASKSGSDTQAASGHTRVLYDLIRTASRSKVLLLTGTPIHNAPVEISFLVNMVAGPITEHAVRFMNPADEATLARVQKLLDEDDRVDVASVTASGATVRLVADGRFRMPDKKRGTLVPVPNSSSATPGATIQDIARKIKHVLPCTKPTASSHDLLPTDPLEFDALFVRSGSLINRGILSRRMVGYVSAFQARGDAQGYPTVTRNETTIVRMGDAQLAEYTRAREYEQRLERRSDDQGDVSVYRHYSRVASNFVFPPGRRGRRQFKFEGMDSTRHEESTQRAASDLRARPRAFWADDTKIAAFAPKFLRIFKRMSAQDAGKSLVYSTFRTWEGIGLFAELLLARGWRRVVIDGNAVKLEETVKGADGPCFVSPQPGDAAGRTLMALFNGRIAGSRSNAKHFDELARLLRVDKDTASNERGETVRAMLISKSGAEGLNLACVRQVHMMEPHWNAVHLQQVQGRAIRLNSHARLPSHERTVAVFTYVATIPACSVEPVEGGEDDAPNQVLQLDKCVSTDEFVAQSAMRKALLSQQFLEALAAAAVDCPVHAHDAARACYAADPEREGNMVPARVFDDKDDPMGRGSVVRVPGPAGAGDEQKTKREVVVFTNSSDVFDAAAYKRSGELVQVGHVRRDRSIAWNDTQQQ